MVKDHHTTPSVRYSNRTPIKNSDTWEPKVSILHPVESNSQVLANAIARAAATDAPKVCLVDPPVAHPRAITLAGQFLSDSDSHAYLLQAAALQSAADAVLRAGGNSLIFEEEVAKVLEGGDHARAMFRKAGAGRYPEIEEAIVGADPDDGLDLPAIRDWLGKKASHHREVGG